MSHDLWVINQFSSLMPETNKRPLMQTTNEAIKFYSESKR